jgi:hypothetical protein
VRQRQVVLLEQMSRGAVGVEVELVDQQHVGPGPLDDLRHRRRLGVVRSRQVLDELPGGVAVE